MCGTHTYIMREARLQTVTSTQEDSNMEEHVWLMWLFAVMLAIMPLSILLMTRSAKPDERCANLERDVASGILVIDDKEYVRLELVAMYIAQAQMRQRWGKDIDSIV